MTDTLILAATAVLVTGIVCATALAAWRGWLKLRHAQVRAERSAPPAAEPDTGQLIELAAVKERLRRLEAIASGVEL